MLQKPHGLPFARRRTRSIPERPISVRATCVPTRAMFTAPARSVEGMPPRSTLAVPDAREKDGAMENERTVTCLGIAEVIPARRSASVGPRRSAPSARRAKGDPRATERRTPSGAMPPSVKR